MKKQILLSIIMLVSCCSLTFGQAGCQWVQDNGGYVHRQYCWVGSVEFGYNLLPTGQCSYFRSGAASFDCATIAPPEGFTMDSIDQLASLAPDGAVSIRIIATEVCPDEWTCPKDTRYPCTKLCLGDNGLFYKEKPNDRVIAPPATGGLAYITIRRNRI